MGNVLIEMSKHFTVPFKTYDCDCDECLDSQYIASQQFSKYQFITELDQFPIRHLLSAHKVGGFRGGKVLS